MTKTTCYYCDEALVKGTSVPTKVYECSTKPIEVDVCKPCDVEQEALNSTYSK